jgi:iron complex outermembrane receptor protein
MVSFHRARGSTSLILGAHAYDYASDHTRDVVGGTREYANRGLKDEANAFAKLSYDPGRWHAYADGQVRWARFRYQGDVPLGSVDWIFVNPKLGLRYDLGTGLGLYASLGRTTREPARSDMLSGEDNASVAHDLGAVRPESVSDIELGTSLERSRLTLKTNLYVMEFRDEIALTGELSEIGLPLRRNVGRSHRRGLELDLAWRPDPALRVNASASVSTNRIAEWTQFFDVYDGDGNWLESVGRAYSDVTPLLTPSAMAHLAVDWSPRTWLALGATGRVVGRTYLDNTDDPALATPRLFELDASARLKLARVVRALDPTLRVKVTNLLDSRRLFPSGYSYLYLTRGASGDDVPGGTAYYYPLATRAVVVTLDMRF